MDSTICNSIYTCIYVFFVLFYKTFASYDNHVWWKENFYKSNMAMIQKSRMDQRPCSEPSGINLNFGILKCHQIYIYIYCTINFPTRNPSRLIAEAILTLLFIVTQDWRNEKCDIFSFSFSIYTQRSMLSPVSGISYTDKESLSFFTCKYFLYFFYIFWLVPLCCYCLLGA